MALFEYSPENAINISQVYGKKSAAEIINALDRGKNPKEIIELMRNGKPKEGQGSMIQAIIQNFKGEVGYQAGSEE